MTFRLHRLRCLLARPPSRALSLLVVAALLIASTSRIGFHSHAEAGDGHGHGHHPAAFALVDHHHHDDQDHAGDDGSSRVLHGHDFGTVATLTLADATLRLATAPSARVSATPDASPDSRPTAPPIRPPIA